MTTGRSGPSVWTTGLVRLEVLLLGRVGGLVQVQELGAVQADALGPAVEAVRRLVGQFDVPEQADRARRRA